MTMLSDKDVTARIDHHKRIRFIAEGLFLVAVLAIIIDALFVFLRISPIPQPMWPTATIMASSPYLTLASIGRGRMI